MSPFPVPGRLGLHVAIACLTVSCADPVPETFTLEGRPNVILLGLDTLRADHLGLYGNETVQTPALDAFASEAVVFERASSTSTWTLPAFASLFTGQLPHEHGAIGGAKPWLSEETTTLAEALRDRGYRTHAFVAVEYLTSEYALDQGFEHLELHLSEYEAQRAQGYRQEVPEFLRSSPAEPFLLFAHYYDAHTPYRPPPPFERMYYEEDPSVPKEDLLPRLLDSEVNRLASSPAIYSWLSGVRDIRFPVSQYAAGVTYLDHLLESVFTSLSETGLLERSVVVVTSDHGEHLLEHDAYFYHRFPYEEVLRVPLVIRLPGGLHGGRRVSDEVSLVDVFPTLVELLELPRRTGFDGVSLAGVLSGGETLPQRVLFAEFGGKRSRLYKAAWDDRYRLIHFQHKDREWMELYDRVEDPGETRNVADVRPVERDRLRLAIDGRFPPERRMRARPKPSRAPISEETKERLRALGYAE